MLISNSEPTSSQAAQRHVSKYTNSASNKLIAQRVNTFNDSGTYSAASQHNAIGGAETYHQGYHKGVHSANMLYHNNA